MTEPECHKDVVTDVKKQQQLQARQITSKWAGADSYKLDAFDQIEGAWPIGHPLPLPKWTTKTKETLIIEKVTIFFSSI